MVERWNPWHEGTYDRIMDDFFGLPFHPWTYARGRIGEEDLFVRKPRTYLSESSEGSIIEVELPGIEKGDIIVSAMEKGIRIEAKKKAPGQGGVAKEYTAFYSIIPLPGMSGDEDIRASFSNGILQLRVPGTKGGRRIDIT